MDKLVMLLTIIMLSSCKFTDSVNFSKEKINESNPDNAPISIGSEFDQKEQDEMLKKTMYLTEERCLEEWLDKKEVYINNNGNKIYAVYYTPQNLSKKTPIVICAHGYNNNFASSRWLLPLLINNGYSVVSFDFRGGSVMNWSEGETKDMTILTEIDDLKAIINEVKGWEYVDSNQIYLIGHSLGGLVSAVVASDMPSDINGLILLSPAFFAPNPAPYTVENMPEYLYEENGMILSKEFFTILHNYDFYSNISKYDKPVLILCGENEKIAEQEILESKLYEVRKKFGKSSIKRASTVD